MEIKDLNEKIEIMDNSPIRQYLKKDNKISLFQDEKNLLSDIDKIIKTNKENLNNPLKIVVLGEVKAGKSTLVNSLISKKVSYTNVVEATATILEIKYSDEEKIIIDKKNEVSINLSSLEALDELMNLNRDNQEFFNEINKITVYTNTERLKEITLVDTPGLNTVTSENAIRTENYILNADVVLWIINSNHLGQSDISEKIEEVLDYGKPIICVLNRIDEIKGNISDITDYVEDEMGYMFTQIFAVSAKRAWDGLVEKDDLTIKESNINELYEYLVNNIERNAEQVQKESIYKSIEVQIIRDLKVHRSTKSRIEYMMERLEEDLKELKQFNVTLKKIIDNKVIEWLDTKFFEKERQLLSSCKTDEFDVAAEKYFSNEYIEKLISSEYEKLNNYIFEEWQNNTQRRLINKQSERQLIMKSEVYFGKQTERIIVDSVTECDSSEDMIEVAKGAVAGGAIGGVITGVGISTLHIIGLIFHPLIIPGAAIGAAWKYFSKKSNKINMYKQIDLLVSELKSIIENNVMNSMKNNLYNTSDEYSNNVVAAIMATLSDCNISKNEIENINVELDRYIRVMEGTINLSLKESTKVLAEVSEILLKETVISDMKEGIVHKNPSENIDDKKLKNIITLEEAQYNWSRTLRDIIIYYYFSLPSELKGNLDNFLAHERTINTLSKNQKIKVINTMYNVLKQYKNSLMGFSNYFSSELFEEQLKDNNGNFKLAFDILQREMIIIYNHICEHINSSISCLNNLTLYIYPELDIRKAIEIQNLQRAKMATATYTGLALLTGGLSFLAFAGLQGTGIFDTMDRSKIVNKMEDEKVDIYLNNAIIEFNLFMDKMLPKYVGDINSMVSNFIVSIKSYYGDIDIKFLKICIKNNILFLESEISDKIPKKKQLLVDVITSKATAFSTNYTSRVEDSSKKVTRWEYYKKL